VIEISIFSSIFIFFGMIKTARKNPGFIIIQNTGGIEDGY